MLTLEIVSQMQLDEIFVQGNEHFDFIYDAFNDDGRTITVGDWDLTSGARPPTPPKDQPKVVPINDLNKLLEELVKKVEDTDVHGNAVKVLFDTDAGRQGDDVPEQQCDVLEVTPPSTESDSFESGDRQLNLPGSGGEVDPYAKLKVKVRP